MLFAGVTMIVREVSVAVVIVVTMMIARATIHAAIMIEIVHRRVEVAVRRFEPWGSSLEKSVNAFCQYLSVVVVRRSRRQTK